MRSNAKVLWPVATKSVNITISIFIIINCITYNVVSIMISIIYLHAGNSSRDSQGYSKTRRQDLLRAILLPRALLLRQVLLACTGLFLESGGG